MSNSRRFRYQISLHVAKRLREEDGEDAAPYDGLADADRPRVRPHTGPWLLNRGIAGLGDKPLASTGTGTLH